MPIRLFTSGIHNGLSFSNTDIERIRSNTAERAPERIPIVLGHPKNDLPVFGFLPKSAIKAYREGDKVSLGFDREAAELDSEGMKAIRSLGRNKISIRVEDGRIKHIGLVKEAAVAENNTQDFAALTGDFAAVDALEEHPKREETGVLEYIKNLFKNNKTDFAMEKQGQEENTGLAEFAELKKDVAAIGDTVNKLTDLLTGQENEKRRSALAADFSKADFSHLTDEQKAKAADFCSKMGDPADIEDYKALLRAGNKKEKPASGSRAADFEKRKKESTAEELIRAQIDGLV